MISEQDGKQTGVITKEGAPGVKGLRAAQAASRYVSRAGGKPRGQCSHLADRTPRSERPGH